MDAQPARLLRFGAFELDVRPGELRKHGVRIRLQDQSFQILLMLLERPGEVVLREEIRQKLWPNNTIVEFDHSINAAIKRLRNALGETAEDPRHIETLAKRGYRFVGQVREEPREGPKDQAKAAEDPPRTATADPDDLSGTTFSHFRVLEKLGRGGMGVVYRAEDLTLGRQVALKFLQFPVDELPDSLRQRFEREARAAAALNHPHICTVYSVDNFAGQPVIVMELLEGETLDARLAKAPLGLEQSLALAIQISSALAEAHGRGVVHRDLKPANIMLTKSGAKVLDFGLAKIEHGVTDEEHTVTARGTILGTVQYMSPEQAQGKDVDARSDIFSFGLVLCEMITGKHAFEGSNSASIIAAIIEREPPALEPEGLNRIARACLAKNPADRFQSALDLKRTIEWSASGDGETPLLEGAAEPGGRPWWLGWSVAAALAVGLATVAFLHFREKLPAWAPPVRFQIPAPGNAATLDYFSLSPDGRKLAFIAGGRLWVHSMESGEARDLSAEAQGAPFWSPDSRVIGYPLQGKVMKIEATGGLPLSVVDSLGSWGGGTWGQDDVIVFADLRVGLFRVPASGGLPAQITALDPGRRETIHFGPSFLPDGRHFVYIRMSTDQEKSAIYLGSVDTKPEQQSSKPLLASNWQPVYASSADPSTGYLLFMREGTLMAQGLDNRRLELKGQAAPVAEQVSDNRGGVGGWGGFSASANDLLFQRSAGSDRRLTWYDREGNVLQTLGEPGDYSDLALSPDGTRLALTRASGADASNIWLLDVSRGGISSRLTFGSRRDIYPAWSPDGGRVIFSSNRDGPYNLYQRPASGVKDEEALLKSSEDKRARSWSRDGRFLLYTVVHAGTKLDIWVLPLEGDRKPVPFRTAEFDEFDAHFSPDGHWVAYTSKESGHNEIYVRSFSMNSAGTAVEAGGKWQISNGYGFDPHWRGDGRELYYRSRDGRVMAVEIAANPVFRPGKPQPLGLVVQADGWDSTADGKRFLVAAPKSSRPEPYTVVLNWQAGLKK